MPESPRWLISKHRGEEALAVLTALEGKGTTIAQVRACSRKEHSTLSAQKVAAEYEMILASIAAEQSTAIRRNTMPKFRLLLGIGAQAMQQLTGINIICYYLPYVLTESVGQKGATARLVSAINSLSYLGATLIGLYLIDRWGRRKLMYSGAIGQCLCWLVITVLLTYAGKAAVAFKGAGNDAPLPSPENAPHHRAQQEVDLGSASVVFFFLFNMFFGAGWQGVSWLYPTEINSTQTRIQGMSLGVATNWAINFAVVFVTPIGIAALKANFYIIWTVCNALIVPTIYFFYPETSGRSLEGIDDMFELNHTIWAGLNKDMKSRGRESMVEGDDAESINVPMDMLPPIPARNSATHQSHGETKAGRTFTQEVLGAISHVEATPVVSEIAASSSEHNQPQTNTHEAMQRCTTVHSTVESDLGRETSTARLL